MTSKRFKIVYEDEWLIVVDKPAGTLVIPTPKKETDTLTNLLNRDLDSRGITANTYPCHRLDRDTSGLIIYAKGKKAQRLMMDEFKKRFVKKRYIAFVRGIIRKDFDTINGRIYNRNKNREESAITRYKVLKRRGGFTILEAEPVTGRTNQIRIHFAAIGHPLLGERVYAFRRDFNIKFKRTALHAKEIEFTHPVTKARLYFSSPLPEDMSELLGTT